MLALPPSQPPRRRSSRARSRSAASPAAAPAPSTALAASPPSTASSPPSSAAASTTTITTTATATAITPPSSASSPAKLAAPRRHSVQHLPATPSTLTRPARSTRAAHARAASASIASPALALTPPLTRTRTRGQPQLHPAVDAAHQSPRAVSREMRSTREKTHHDAAGRREDDDGVKTEAAGHGLRAAAHSQKKHAAIGELDPPHKHSSSASSASADEHDRDDEADEDGDEEEITRCVCGSQDYPGLPGIYRELLSKGELPGHPAMHLPPPPSAHSLRRTTASKPADDADADADDAQDPGSLFIQCDGCKVWQHGGCVGIMDEEASPEEYYCERCRGDLHRIVIDGKGHRSSRYIPVVGDDAKAMSPLPSPLPPSRERSRSNTATTLPPASARDRRSRNRESRELRNMQDVNAPPLHASGPAKRRSTMNSRDAAYDGLELRRDDDRDREKDRDKDLGRGSRRAKRSRSGEEKDDKLTAVKRQRTSSPSPLAHPAAAASRRAASASDDEHPPHHYAQHSRHASQRYAPAKSTRSTASRTSRDVHAQHVSDSDIDITDSPTTMTAVQKRGKDVVRDDEDAAQGAQAAGKRKREQDEGVGALKRAHASPPVEVTAADAAIETASKGDGGDAVSLQPSASTHSANGAASGKRSSRTPAKRSGRGRNQYTKDRDWKDDAGLSNESESAGANGTSNGSAAHEDDRPDTRAGATARTAREKSGSSAPESPLPIRNRSTNKSGEADGDDGGTAADNAAEQSLDTSANGSRPLATRSRPGTMDSHSASLSGDATAPPPSGHQRTATAASATASTGDRGGGTASTPAPGAAPPAASTPTLPHHSRMSMNDMRRRVAAILEFISRTQLDMAANGERLAPPKEKAKGGARAPGGGGKKEGGKEGVGKGEKEEEEWNDDPDEVEFEKLSSSEMMDVLTRGLLKWQQEFGKYGDR